MKIGISIAPAVTNIREPWRTVAVFSASGPTMKPGVSHRDSIGTSKASHSCMNREALVAPSESMAPPRWRGSLAISPMGRPSMRTKAVIMPRPKAGRSSSTEPASASTWIRAWMS